MPVNPFSVPAPAGANPFESTPSPAMGSPSSITSRNPFDPFATLQVSADVIAPGPGTQPHLAAVNPFEGPQQQAPASFPQAMNKPSNIQQTITAPLQQSQQPQAYAQPQGPPFVQSFPQVRTSNDQQTPIAKNNAALVASQQASNPYAGLVFSQQHGNPFEHALVQVAAPAGTNQWANAPAQPALFDPYAAPVQPASIANPPQPQPNYDTHQQVPLTMELVPNNYQQPPQQLAAPPEPVTFDDPPHHEAIVPYDVQGEHRNIESRGEIVPYQPQNELGTDIVVGGVPEPPIGSPINKYSHVLAQNAPPGSAPLPKGDLVLKSGYVLGRISFRTVLMKKWKQVYWVQYGPHTMLWFRSYADFDDWLNNPYLTQDQRNYLIKLAVNFVHDLYKPNVRGYQVTQARSKAYGRKMLKQFKLERWMDYGPTIAGAFASHDANEIDDLRQAIVECMRNTPLGDGIRATGAVRQEQSYGEETEQYAQNRRSYEARDDDSHVHPYSNNHAYGGQGAPSPIETIPPKEVDLLGGFDGDDDGSISNYSQGPGFYGVNGFESAQRAPQGYASQHQQVSHHQGYPPRPQQVASPAPHLGYPPQPQQVALPAPNLGFPPQPQQVAPLAPHQGYPQQQGYSQQQQQAFIQHPPQQQYSQQAIPSQYEF